MIITGYGNYIGLGLLPVFGTPSPVFTPTPVLAAQSLPSVPPVLRLSPAAMRLGQPYIGPMTPQQFAPQVIQALQQAQAVPPAGTPAAMVFSPQTGVTVVPSMIGPSPYTTLFSPQRLFQVPIPGTGCPPGSVSGKYPDTCIPIGNTQTMVPQGQTLSRVTVNVTSPRAKANSAGGSTTAGTGEVVAPTVTPDATPTNNKTGLVMVGAAALLLIGLLK